MRRAVLLSVVAVGLSLTGASGWGDAPGVESLTCQAGPPADAGRWVVAPGTRHAESWADAVGVDPTDRYVGTAVDVEHPLREPSYGTRLTMRDASTGATAWSRYFLGLETWHVWALPDGSMIVDGTTAERHSAGLPDSSRIVGRFGSDGPEWIQTFRGAPPVATTVGADGQILLALASANPQLDVGGINVDASGGALIVASLEPGTGHATRVVSFRTTVVPNTVSEIVPGSVFVTGWYSPNSGALDGHPLRDHPDSDTGGGSFATRIDLGTGSTGWLRTFAAPVGHATVGGSTAVATGDLMGNAPLILGGAKVAPPAHQYGSWVAGWDVLDGSVQWAEVLTTWDGPEVYLDAVTSDLCGQVLFVGHHTVGVTITPLSGASTELHPSGSGPAMLGRLDPSDGTLNDVAATGEDDAVLTGVTTDATGHVYVAGNSRLGSTVFGQGVSHPRFQDTGFFVG